LSAISNSVTDLQILRITNLTSGIDLHKAANNEILELTEFGPENLCFLLPKAAGKNLLVNIESNLIINGNTHLFNLSGKIIEVEKNADRGYSIKLELHHFDRELWSEFIFIRKKQQAKVDDLFKRVKGEE